MTRRTRGRRVAHGATFEAPSEFGFVTSESPPPGPVTAKAASTGEDAGAPPSVGAVVLSALKLSIGLAVVASISVAIAWGAHRYALTTPRFAVREIDVRGNRHHAAAQLAKIAGLERGQNLFSVDTGEAERRLLNNPWVRQARVGRTLPGTLRIDVAEREAVAAATLEDSLYLVTPEGEPFKAIETGDPADLPVITGVGPRDLAVDRARAVDRLAVAIEVLREYAALPMSKVYEAEEVHLVADGSVVFTIGKRGTTLYLGKGPFRQKLLMAARVIGKLQASGELPGIVFLDNEAHPERVVVRMR
jgi:cell division protein FtsQ